MKQIPIGFPPALEEFAKDQATKNIESLAAYVRRLILEDQRRKESTNATA